MSAGYRMAAGKDKECMWLISHCASWTLYLVHLSCSSSNIKSESKMRNEYEFIHKFTTLVMTKEFSS